MRPDMLLCCRLAMLAFAGFAAQARTTGKSPLDNLFDHLADPFGVNVFTSRFITSLGQLLSASKSRHDGMSDWALKLSFACRRLGAPLRSALGLYISWPVRAIK